MTEAEVLALVAQRHTRDLWVTGVAIGSRWAGARELDGWALRRSWSPETTFGYEVKVSRGDWLRDQKIAEYAKHVHLMFVVAPEGIVQATELPVGCGLLEVAKTGRRLFTRQKTVRNEHPDLLPIALYLLMSRVRITKNMQDRGELRAERLAAALEGTMVPDSRELGTRVAREVGVYREDLERRVHEAEIKEGRCQKVESVARELGIDLGSWGLEAHARERFQDIARLALSELESAESVMRDARQRLEARLNAQKASTP